MTFDVSQFENADQGSFNVLRQNGDEMMIDGKPIVITMHGPGTKAEVSAERKLKRAAAVSITSTLQGRHSPTAEDDEFRRRAEYLAACTISVDNWPAEGGALAIYLNPKLGYITAQAERFLSNPVNFMKGSTPS